MYPLFIGLSFVAGSIATGAYMLKARIDIRLVFLSVILNALLSLMGGVLMAMVMNGFKTMGLSGMGGAFGMISGMFVLARIMPDYRTAIFKANILAIPLMYSVSKLACYYAGCCGGTGQFPVQLAEVIVFALIFAVSLWLIYFKDSPKGMIITILLCCAGKFSLDFLREIHSQQRGLSPNQILCLLVAVASIGIGFIRKTRSIKRDLS